MTRLKIVVAGGGLISQVEHIPNLIFLADQFELIGVADPSAATRAHITRQFGIPTFATVAELWDLRPDAVVIGAPDSYHQQIAIDALERGIHVFCEKPLALSVADIDELIRAREASGRVLQVGFMKRWDPSYEFLSDQIRGRGEKLRFIAVECNDPDSWPFVAHHAFRRADDVPADARAENAARLRAQTSAALGRDLSKDDIYSYVDSFSSSMIHDLNAVSGLLESMGIVRRKAVAAQIFAGGRGTSATLALNGAQAICHLAHVVVPDLADYHERISLFFDDRRYELIFPSPYLHNLPTRLIEFRSEGMHLTKIEHRIDYQEPFMRELQGFWQSITQGTAVRNTAEEAREDMRLVHDFMMLSFQSRSTL